MKDLDGCRVADNSSTASYIKDLKGCRLDNEMRRDVGETCAHLLLHSESYDDTSTFQSLSTTQTSYTYESSSHSPGILSFFTGETTCNDSITDNGDNDKENQSGSYGQRQSPSTSTKTSNSISLSNILGSDREEMKEVTIMPIRSRSRAQFFVKGAPKRAHSVAGVRSRTGLSRDKSITQYRRKSHKSGKLIQRIKSRPILTDNSKPTIPKRRILRNRVRKEQRKSTTRDVPLILHAHEDDVSLLTTPALDPVKDQKSATRVELDAEKTNHCIVLGNNTAPTSRGVDDISKLGEWRKEIPQPEPSPREIIESVEVTYDPIVPKKSFWNRNKSVSSQNEIARYNVTAEMNENTNDQATTCEPLLDDTTLPNSNGEQVKPRIRKRRKSRFSASITKSLSSKKTDNSPEVDKETPDPEKIEEQKEIVINPDGSVMNQKVVYKMNRDSETNKSSELKVLESGEDLVPKKESSDILVRVEVSN